MKGEWRREVKRDGSGVRGRRGQATFLLLAAGCMLAACAWLRGRMHTAARCTSSYVHAWVLHAWVLQCLGACMLRCCNASVLQCFTQA